MEREDFKTSKNVLVLAEINEDRGIPNIVLQLLDLGKDLASRFGERLYAIIIGKDISCASKELSRYGTDVVFSVDDRNSEYNPDNYLPVLEQLCKNINPRLILSGHTSIGQDLLPRLAFTLNAGLVTDCVDIKVTGGEFSFIRPIYGGNVLATQRVTSTIALATVRVGVGKHPTPSKDSGKIIPLVPTFPEETRIKITGKTLVDQKECSLEEASVVVSGGRGVGGKEGFQMLLELARLLGGAMGATRPPCDLGWVPSSRQIGITGKVIAPDLYVAVAISGSTQHLSGMSDSRKIVAINKDPEANIFNVSDYGMVGDWRQILLSFTARLKDLMKNRI